MSESIHKYFKIGTLLWMSFPKENAEEATRRIARDVYFDVLEVNHIDCPETRKAMAKVAKESRLQLGYGVHPTILGRKLNPNALEESERREAEQALLEAVDEAAEMGAGGIAFLSGKWEPETKEDAYCQLLKTTRAVCSYAADRGLMVELEVFDYDVDKCSLIGPAPLAARFAADIRTTHTNFGLLVDLSHIPLTHEDPEFVIRTLRPYLTHFHIGSAVTQAGLPSYGDKHPRFGFPGGVNDVEELREFLCILRQEGFWNPVHPYILSFEVTPQPGEDAEMVLAGCKRVLDRAWALASEP